MALFKARVEASLPAGDLAVFGFWLDSVNGVQAVADDVSTLINNWMTTQGLQAFYTSNLTMVQAVVGLYTSVTGLQQTRADSAINAPGTVDETITPPLPGDVAVCVSLETALANRRGRGRFYMPSPVSSAVTTDGKLTTTARTAFHQGFVDAWNAVNPGTLVVASRANNDTSNVTAVACGDLFDTQRRRENAVSEARGRTTM